MIAPCTSAPILGPQLPHGSSVWRKPRAHGNDPPRLLQCGSKIRSLSQLPNPLTFAYIPPTLPTSHRRTCHFHHLTIQPPIATLGGCSVVVPATNERTNERTNEDFGSDDDAIQSLNERRTTNDERRTTNDERRNDLETPNSHLLYRLGAHPAHLCNYTPQRVITRHSV